MITISRGFAIGQASSMTGVNIETIRYYEKIGLVPRQARNTNGRRNYDDTDVRRFAFIRRAREIGFSLNDIRSLLMLAEPGHRSCVDVQKIAEQHRAAVETRIADLKRLHLLLSETIGKCSGRKAPQCAVLDMLASPKELSRDQV